MKLKQIIYFGVISALVIALILMTFIFIPSDNADTQGSVKKIYFADHISDSHQKVIDRFNELYKGQIEVAGINLPFTKFSTNERKELLARFLRSRSDRIDVFSVDQIWVPRFAKWSLTLDQFFNKQETNSILDYAMQSCRYNDSLYAIPSYIDISLMYYRDDLLKKFNDYEILKAQIERSISWEDFIDLNKRYKQNNNPFFFFQADDFEGLMCIFVEMMSSQGKELIINGELQLDSPEAYKALRLLVDFVQKYKISPPEVTSLKENQTYINFIEEDALFLRGWPSFIRDLSKNEQYREKLSNVIKVPNPHFKNGKRVSVYGGWNLMISKYTSNTYESLKFIEFLMSTEAQAIMYEGSGYLPVSKIFYTEDSYLKKYPDLEFYKNLLDNGVHRPFTENYTSISDILSFYLNSAIKGEISVEMALSEAAQKINSESILIK
jgi:multiple sugar transport system substrate-binding protein